MSEGDYVRTKYGITQFKEYETTNGEKLLCMPVKDGSQGIFANIEDVVKSRPNIIDLIEVGDYVNGKYVDKYQGKLGVFCELPNGKWEFIELTNEHYLISSIVTKEQFSCMEYKIGE